MKIVLDSLKAAPVAVLSPQNLEDLLRQGEVLREEDTHMSDIIRIVDWQGTILVQEKTNKDEFIIRKMDSRDQAEKFLQNRLDTYERMWDG